jgi:hypothetical protein
VSGECEEGRKPQLGRRVIPHLIEQLVGPSLAGR